MFLSIFVAIALTDLTKFFYDMKLCCKYQQFIVNKYLWIQKFENRHLYTNIHLQASQDSSVSTGTYSWQDNQSFITGSTGVLSFLLHPGQLWYFIMCLHRTVASGSSGCRLHASLTWNPSLCKAVSLSCQHVVILCCLAYGNIYL
jgi:hypothetical protein